MLKIIRSYALKLDIPQMTIVGSKKAPLTNKSNAKIDKQATLKAGRLRKFEASAGAVGKAQKTLRSATATKEQRDKAKATIKRAAEKMRSGNAANANISFEKLHPRYPKGTPGGKGGKFMPKGSADYKAAVANNLAVEVKAGRVSLNQAREAAKEAGITTPPQEAPAKEAEITTPPQEAPAKEKPAKKAKEPKSVSQKVGNTSKVNPYAIEDLTPDSFAKYLEDREFLDTQDKISSPKKLEVFNLIKTGFAPSDEDIAKSKAKLTKADQKLLAQNRAEIEKKRQAIAPIEKAFQAPLMTDKDAKGWKPVLSPEEANKYVASSFTGQNEFYHGNGYDRVIKGIEKDGLDPERNRQGIFGKGGYLATSKDVASEYAQVRLGEGSDAGIVTVKVKVKNPLVTDSENLSRMGTHFVGDQSNLVDSVAVHNYVRAIGHDSIFLKDLGYLITFDKRQAVTVGSEKIPVDSDRAKEIQDFWKGKLTIEERKELAAESPTSKALAKTKNTNKVFKENENPYE